MNISSSFKEKRGNDYHEGTDYTALKGTPITSISDGVVSLIMENHSAYGKCIWVKAKLENTVVFFLYGHLHTIKVKQGLKVTPDIILGTMGNTGHCLTLDEGIWRKLTTKEITDPTCQKGVHLHLSIYTKRKNSLFEQILKIKKLITSENMFANTYYTSNWKYKNQCFNPEMVKKYLKGIYNA